MTFMNSKFFVTFIGLWISAIASSQTADVFFESLKESIANEIHIKDDRGCKLNESAKNLKADRSKEFYFEIHYNGEHYLEVPFFKSNGRLASLEKLNPWRWSQTDNVGRNMYRSLSAHTSPLDEGVFLQEVIFTVDKVGGSIIAVEHSAYRFKNPRTTDIHQDFSEMIQKTSRRCSS